MNKNLDCLLRPRSIALVGASPRAGSFGNGMIEACFRANYEGDAFLINPNYDSIEERKCYPDFESLPSVPEHAMLMLANERIEAAFTSAIDAGVKAVSIFGTCYLEDGNKIPLVERLRGMAEEANIQVCGGNGSGFYNREDKVRCQMGGGDAEDAGPVTFISQSGSIWGAITANDGRLKFNLTVSSGQEITTDASDYMEFALGLESTKAIGLYLETIRNPEKFISVLIRAAEANIPVVITKIARSEQGKKFAISHSGALAGDDAVYKAVFERYGALHAHDPDALFATLQLLSTGRRAARGNVVAIAESGGERELLADVASDNNVSFAEITEDTRSAIQSSLEPGLEAENPLDAWGTGYGFEETFHDCMKALLDDPNAALGVWVADIQDNFIYHESHADSAIRISQSTDKPLAFATCFEKGTNSRLANRLAAAGIPVLEGMRPSVEAVRSLLDYRSFQNKPTIAPPPAPKADVIQSWRDRCTTGVPFSDIESFSLLRDFGIPVVGHRMVANREQAIEAAIELGFPVVLKTAVPGIFHKSDVDGVHLGLADEAAVKNAFEDLAARLGTPVMVSKMASPGVEVSFGFIADPQFGSIAMIGAGGTLIEILKDMQLAVPPLDEAVARELIDRMIIRPMLDGFRGGAPCDISGLAQAFANFSVLIASLGSDLAEIDVNPLIVTVDGILVVDALIIPKNDNNNNYGKE